MSSFLCPSRTPACAGQALDNPDIGLLLQEMRGKAMPQRMYADALGDAGTPRCQANDPVELARTHVLPAVAGKQPGLSGRHPALLARNVPPFRQYRERERMTYRSFLPLPCSTRMTIRSRSISVSLSDTTSDARTPVE